MTPPAAAPERRHSRRTEILENRAVNLDGFIDEWPEVGLVAMESDGDPAPSLRIAGGQIVEMDGKSREDFDFLDQFVADRAIDLSVAEASMALASDEIARRLISTSVPRAEVIALAKGLTPAKLLDVMKTMNVVEMMMAMQKLRARRTTANQAHATSSRDNPVQIVADAAEGALRGFAELETTLGVVRYAPMAALALLIGAQTGRAGVLTQCALEEATELALGMRGLTTYAETISIYGTESVFVDGDDTPWSKSFLASAYASRGIKMRFTSGTGSEVQMGNAEGRSMLYLEIRCIMTARGAGVQGLQNGSISCIGVPGAVPSGIRAVLAENLVASMLDLECASGNDQSFSHSDMRRTARGLMQLLPGTDFVCSGFSSVPNLDNMFAGSNFDAEDYDDWNTLQRDLKVDGGLRHVDEDEVVAIRGKAARALQAVFEQFGFPPITEAEIEAVTYGHSSDDLPKRPVVEDLRACQDMSDRGLTGLDVVKALDAGGFHDIAENLFNTLRQRVAGDLLQTAAIIGPDGFALSAVNDANDYTGPATGYRPEGKRWEEMKRLRHTTNANVAGGDSVGDEFLGLKSVGVAQAGSKPDEVVVAISPAFGLFFQETIVGVGLDEVLREILAGIEEEGVQSRVIRVVESCDLARVAHRGARLSGSGIAVGVLSRGTTMIHQKELPRLSSLELFPQAPLMDLETFRHVGRNAARYAKNEAPEPVPIKNDYMARPRFQAKAALLHIKETEFIQPGEAPLELQ